MIEDLTLDAIRAAAERIHGQVVRTPVLVRRVAAAELIFKPECLQETGSFKLRGAFSLLTTLPPGVPGVVAHSSGNHAQAVARAARELGIHAIVVMPGDAPVLKRARTTADGAEIVTVGPDSEERKARAAAIAAERGFVPVPPYDHPLVAAGQGTAALELIEDVGPIDRFYAPVSGGGLMAGCATAVGALSPSAECVGVEPVDGNDTFLSLGAGRREHVPPPRTIADGLRVRTPGEATFEVIRRRVARIALVTDEEMLAAMAWALAELRLVLEPSGAASLAAVLREAREGAAGRFGVLLSGGNVDPAVLARAMGTDRESPAGGEAVAAVR